MRRLHHEISEDVGRLNDPGHAASLPDAKTGADREQDGVLRLVRAEKEHRPEGIEAATTEVICLKKIYTRI